MKELDPSWRKEANCKGVKTDIFFSQYSLYIDIAKALCQACVVRSECLEYALEKPENHGIWGETSERGRRKILRNRKKEPGAIPENERIYSQASNA